MYLCEGVNINLFLWTFDNKFYDIVKSWNYEKKIKSEKNCYYVGFKDLLPIENVESLHFYFTIYMEICVKK